MPTTQSADPNEEVTHPRRYNAHKSGVECIELVEHLPANLANAVKYVWRRDLKGNPVQDLQKAAWYTRRERQRMALFELYDLRAVAQWTEDFWQNLAAKVIASDPDSTLSRFLRPLLRQDFKQMLSVIENAIDELRDTDKISADQIQKALEK